MSDSRVSSVAAMHRKQFGAGAQLYQAPGRVNLIGEHTDTSEGYVMPAALDLRTLSVLSPRADLTANIYSANFHQQVTVDLGQMPSAARGHWSDYPVSVLWSLQRRGIHCRGFDMTLAGNVPIGSGLSSSASIEVAVAVAVLDYAQTTLPKPEIAKICQIAENQFVGAQSGIMDPFASCCGVKDHAILLDCRSLQYEPLPLPEQVAVVICNSMVKHSHSDGREYNQRRSEFEEGMRTLRSRYPKMQTLRDIGEQELSDCAELMPDHIFRRCWHVVSENRRVLQAAAALREGDFVRFGELMVQAHYSMRDNYEASCVEVDILVELAMLQTGCFGARITGGGFGGCTVNLVASKNADAFVENVRRDYREKTGIEAEIYLSYPSDGAGPVPEA